jgi:hypothetical protein
MLFQGPGQINMLLDGSGQLNVLLEGTGQINILEGTGQINMLEGTGQINMLEGTGQINMSLEGAVQLNKAPQQRKSCSVPPALYTAVLTVKKVPKFKRPAFIPWCLNPQPSLGYRKAATK